jgi:hypothetical protein
MGSILSFQKEDIPVESKNSEYTKLLNQTLDDHSEETEEDARYVEQCTRNYINKNQFLKNRMKLFYPYYTFIKEEEFDVLVTANTQFKDVTFTKEYFERESGEMFSTVYVDKLIRIETMPGVYNANLSNSIITSNDEKTIFSGEQYLNGQVFIKDIITVLPDKKVTTHELYSPNNELYCTCDSYKLSEIVDRFLNEYEEDIISLTQ